jgi:hypothetical protein
MLSAAPVDQPLLDTGLRDGEPFKITSGMFFGSSTRSG